MTNFNGKKIALQIDDHSITGEDCVISNFTITTNNNIQPLYGKDRCIVDYMPTNTMHTITIELIAKDLIFVDKLLNNTDLIKIRNKKVENCSVEELLFAIRKKIERKKNGSRN